jgi:hypothetical protein
MAGRMNGRLKEEGIQTLSTVEDSKRKYGLYFSLLVLGVLCQ